MTDAPERIMVAKCYPFKEPDDLYVCHPQLQHPAAVEFTRADLCADPALLAEAVEVLRAMIANACVAAEIKGDMLMVVCTNEEWDAHVSATEAARAFIAKLENRHDR